MTEADKPFADGLTPDLHPAQIEAYRAMSFSDKLAAVSRLYSQAWNMKKAWLKSQHPDWSEQRVTAETRKIFLYAE